MLFSLNNNIDGVTNNNDVTDNNDVTTTVFPQAWEMVTTQWRVVGGSSLHNTVEVFTNKNRVYLS